MSLSDARAGAAAVAPMVIGVIPFGLVAGATPMATGLGAGAALGFSTIVFAGASQLAAIDVLAGDGSVAVAILAAWTINLRMLLYSASLAPYLAGEPFWRRLAGSYLLVDQVYAVCVTRWPEEDEPRRRIPFMVGAGLLLWAIWEGSTLTGTLVGSALPDRIPLDFAVPLVFLVLLVPAVTTRPAVVAAAAGGIAAVLAAEAGAGGLSVMAGA
ncbi:MAG: AzlC family ABC transporter permease, partial [Actinomycetota bacterium]|nr:AzlC family ABC transporter permease [Actinomycetota bacterium]